MEWFANLKINAKLGFAFAFMTIMIAALGASGYGSLGGPSTLLTAASETHEPLLEHLGQLQRDLQQVLEGDSGATMDAIRAEIDGLIKRVETSATTASELRGKVHDARVLQLSLLVAALGTALALGWVLSRFLTGPLNKTLGMAENIAKGDFSQRLGMQHRDETGLLAQQLDLIAQRLTRQADFAENIAQGHLEHTVELASDRDQLGKALQHMSDGLNDLVSRVQTSVQQIDAGSQMVATASQILSQGATQSAASIEEISASMTQMSSQTRMTAANANQAHSLSKGSSNAAARGDKLMEELVGAMEEIDRSGQDINKIIKVIDEIAFQTNLLALNAAVEAARAGQHGKGFAVVAEEVRNLAARSARAAKETAQLIEGSAEKTRNGSSIASRTAAALKGIVAGAAKVSGLVDEIAAAANEQAAGFEQVSRGLTQIEQVTQQNTGHAEESAAAATELSSQSAQLKAVAGRFQVRGGSMVSVSKMPEARKPEKMQPVKAARSRSVEIGQGAVKRQKSTNLLPAPARKVAAESTVKVKPAPAPRPVPEKKVDLKPEEIIALDDSEFGRY
ncbi:MAG: methyl-accepting chemotaxis protein [Pedobacter sp.]